MVTHICKSLLLSFPKDLLIPSIPSWGSTEINIYNHFLKSRYTIHHVTWDSLINSDDHTCANRLHFEWFTIDRSAICILVKPVYSFGINFDSSNFLFNIIFGGSPYNSHNCQHNPDISKVIAISLCFPSFCFEETSHFISFIEFCGTRSPVIMQFIYFCGSPDSHRVRALFILNPAS